MKGQILVVDDERLIRNSLHGALEQLGHQARVAGSLEEATQAVADARYDLVILDLKLGDGDGLDLLRRLRTEAPETKVVVITAHGSIEAAVAAMKLGAFDFVKKPFEVTSVVSTRGAGPASGPTPSTVTPLAEGRRALKRSSAMLMPRSNIFVNSPS